ncbi:MbtH family protein [Burkholderia ubonensis]|uniref:Antibiotic synthesis protein MbtH n=1 Tax=Burkholderia ubonensis TaxID=101571 RepID=A0ABD4E7V2_9BURK|nr:MbtH family NRPS accessory protein [Burkholderia ubonensis]KVN88991.1 antibiotic synthesis protein MbtH [Burkholderia ubonensis]
MNEADDDTVLYQVVVNDEEQYSIWFLDRDLPAGWRPEGTVGSRAICLQHIDTVWTDMRPLSVRRSMDAAAGDSETH